MVLINSKELLKHQIAVHIDKMFQCQSCNKIFGTKNKFENHVVEIHDNPQKATVIPGVMIIVRVVKLQIYQLHIR